MYIFGYFFQKGHFKGSSKKRAHRQKFWGGSWRPNGHPPPTPPLLRTACTLDKRITSKSQFREFWVFWWKFAKFLLSFSKPQVNFSSNFASLFSAMKDNSFVLFWLEHYILWSKKSPLKCRFLRLLSARFKIPQIPHVNVETAGQFLSKFCIIFHYHDT